MNTQLSHSSQPTKPLSAGQLPERPGNGEIVPTSPAQPTPAVASASRQEMIVTAAYYRAERRGFAPGGELADWLESECEVDRRQMGGNDLASNDEVSAAPKT